MGHVRTLEVFRNFLQKVSVLCTTVGHGIPEKCVPDYLDFVLRAREIPRPEKILWGCITSSAVIAGVGVLLSREDDPIIIRSVPGFGIPVSAWNIVQRQDWQVDGKISFHISAVEQIRALLLSNMAVRLSRDGACVASSFPKGNWQARYATLMSAHLAANISKAQEIGTLLEHWVLPCSGKVERWSVRISVEGESIHIRALAYRPEFTYGNTDTLLFIRSPFVTIPEIPESARTKAQKIISHGSSRTVRLVSQEPGSVMALIEALCQSGGSVNLLQLSYQEEIDSFSLHCLNLLEEESSSCTP